MAHKLRSPQIFFSHTNSKTTRPNYQQVATRQSLETSEWQLSITFGTGKLQLAITLETHL